MIYKTFKDRINKQLNKIMAKEIQCPNCEYVGKPKYWHNKLGVVIGDVLLLGIALIFFWTIIVPAGIGMFYLLTMTKTYCPKCGFNYLVKK